MNGNTNSFNPVGEPVIEKTYARSDVQLTPQELSSDIPQQTFERPPARPASATGSGSNNAGGGGNTSQRPASPGYQRKEPIDPGWNELSGSEKHHSADRLATICVSGYEYLHELATTTFLQFKPKTIAKLQSQGKLDTNLMVTIDEEGTQMPMGHLLNEFNEQAAQALKVSQKFKDEVIPVATKIFKKKGVGASDEHYLAYLVGKDLFSKGIIVASLKSSMNDLLKNMQQQTQMMREQMSGAAPSNSGSGPAPSSSFSPEPEVPGGGPSSSGSGVTEEYTVPKGATEEEPVLELHAEVVPPTAAQTAADGKLEEGMTVFVPNTVPNIADGPNAMVDQMARSKRNRPGRKQRVSVTEGGQL